MADPAPSSSDPRSTPPGAAPGKTLTPAARRALEEAAERRATAKPLELPPEEGGQAGPEPTRYGDWEKNGIASDF
ncbi:MAG: DUF1674 domain-containing protein [Caulobacteraceae bacterium]